MRTGRSRQAGVAVVVALLFATSPDVDLHVAELAHRGLTHTVWAAFVVAGLTTVAGAFVALIAAPGTGGSWRWPRRVTATSGGWAGGVTVGSHLLGDMLTPMGVRPFAPFVGADYSLALVAAREPTANRALFVAGVLAMTVALHRGFSHGGSVPGTGLGDGRLRRGTDARSPQGAHASTTSQPVPER